MREPDFPGQLGRDLSAALPGGRSSATSPTPPYHRGVSPDVAQRIPGEARRRNRPIRTGYGPRRRLGRRQTAVTTSPERASILTQRANSSRGGQSRRRRPTRLRSRSGVRHPSGRRWSSGAAMMSAASGWLRAAGIGHRQPRKRRGREMPAPTRTQGSRRAIQWTPYSPEAGSATSLQRCRSNTRTATRWSLLQQAQSSRVPSPGHGLGRDLPLFSNGHVRASADSLGMCAQGGAARHRTLLPSEGCGAAIRYGHEY